MVGSDVDDLVVAASASLQGVTEGPWEVRSATTSGYASHYGVGSFRFPGVTDVVHAHTDYEGYGLGSSKADATFIAQARTLVPKLAAEVEQLRSLPDDIAQQCEFVLTQPVGVEARTLATLILGLINPDESNDDDDD